jgi:glycolate oxidase
MAGDFTVKKEVQMGISREAYKVLEDIVGPEYLSEDPVDMEAYRGGLEGYGASMGFAKVMSRYPAAVIMPKTTEEVQRIVKACNRYKVPYIAVSTMFWLAQSVPHVDNALLIDLKRMDKLEIDEEQMYAVVESAVVYSQLQEQAMQRGLYTTVPGGGSQVSVVANMLDCGFSPLNFRNGFPSRRLLGVEWILPDGEILRTGSLAFGHDPFWGEGPGPELRGILRGNAPGWNGSLGICTQMAVKLSPFQPERLKPIGISPDTALQLPTNRMRWLNYALSTRNALVEAMYKISEAEVSAAMTKVPVFFRVVAKAGNKEEFWELWRKESDQSIANFHVLRVLLVGYTSEEQLDYEERVLNDIMTELGGEVRRTKQTDESWFKNADSAGMWVMTGGYISIEYCLETIESAAKQGEDYAELKQKYTPPLMPDYRDPGWFQSVELGHSGYFEFLIYYDPRMDTIKRDHCYLESAKLNIQKGYWTSFNGSSQPINLTGPAYGPNFHLWMKKIKEAFDANWLANPPVPFEHDEFIERADWMRPLKDWKVTVWHNFKDQK